MGIKTLGDDVERTYDGKKLPPRYDWQKDPNHYTTNGHIPDNRCYHCGYRFIGSQYAAFCNVCDNAMSPDVDESIFIVTDKEKGEGYNTTRREMVQDRIRIPDDVADEKAYAKKLNISEIKPGGVFRADQLV